MDSFVGREIGKYTIVEQLGTGGMAVVYKAYDSSLERYVAIKFIRKETIGEQFYPQMIQRFDREAKVLANLNHPNILAIHEYGNYQGSPYLVMQYVSGGALRPKGAMPFPQAARLLAPVARALEYAHRRGIVHRDIKPDNILITENGDPTLSDFGIAKILDTTGTGAQNTMTSTGMAVGTPEYMAPEQWQGKPVPQSDMYALGVVLYELVTGRLPYMAETPGSMMLKQATEPLPRPRQWVRDLPEAVETVILKTLALKPENRYASMGDFAAALDGLAQGAVRTGTGPLSAPPRPTPAPVAPDRQTPPSQPAPERPRQETERETQERKRIEANEEKVKRLAARLAAEEKERAAAAEQARRQERERTAAAELARRQERERAAAAELARRQEQERAAAERAQERSKRAGATQVAWTDEQQDNATAGSDQREEEEPAQQQNERAGATQVARADELQDNAAADLAQRQEEERAAAAELALRQEKERAAAEQARLQVKARITAELAQRSSPPTPAPGALARSGEKDRPSAPPFQAQSVLERGAGGEDGSARRGAEDGKDLRQPHPSGRKRLGLPAWLAIGGMGLFLVIGLGIVLALVFASLGGNRQADAPAPTLAQTVDPTAYANQTALTKLSATEEPTPANEPTPALAANPPGYYGLNIDGRGNIIAADTWNDRIVKFSPEGTILAQWGGNGAAEGQLDAPRGVAVDGDGHVYVADTNNNRIQVFSADGNFLSQWGSPGSIGGEFNSPSAIAVNKNGDVYVADTGNNRIQKFNGSGSLVVEWGSLGGDNSQFNQPQGIAVDGAGNVYVADTGNNRIQKFNTDGLFLAAWGLYGAQEGQFLQPGTVAVDNTGKVFVVDSNNNRIQKFSADGTYISQWGKSGSGNGEFTTPQGIAISESWDIFVADTHNNRIQKFTPEGDFLSLWEGR